MTTTLRPVHELAVITRATALAEGWTDEAIRAQLRKGAWRRIRHGSYLPTELYEQLDDIDRHRARAISVSRRAGCTHAWSHVTALAHLGMPCWGLDLATVHVTRFDDRCGRRGDVAQHRGASYVSDLTVRDGVLVTSGTRTALDLAGTVDLEAAVAVVGSLLHAGETTREQLEQRVKTMEQWPDSLVVRRVLRLADPRPESVAEHRFVVACSRAGLPGPVPQLPVRIDGRTYRLDFAWPELKVWVEVDGRSKYERWLRPGESPGDAVFREKRREDRIREVTGWTCVRVTWADLADPVRLERRLRRALRLMAG